MSDLASSFSQHETDAPSSYLAFEFAVQVESIDDIARSQLEVIRQTETHPEGEKLLAELRKRKLITAR
jgi:hypothetical protein